MEQIKTQVLLLHSEQSTLDNLSSGFNDRYTVHCATSGTEALNTLGETPIHVIVSAQDLPGMSGVEALREAKKRSPETIGILLAGRSDESLEALVGDKEVFQIVRGGITSADLTTLIDNATQQVRLLAISESANDMAANVDEPATEHIVMETSETGAAIISDGTGTVPVLDPQRVSAYESAGSRAVELLVLTKDEEFLATIRESSGGMHAVHYANTLAQAEAAIAKHKVGVAVVDAAMVGPNVEKLTLHLRSKTPRLVSIVAGRRDDGEMLMDLINRGKVYRFLLKPVSPGRARLAVEASVKHHLEAPDAAFKIVGQASVEKPAPKTKPQAKAKPTPAAKQTRQPKKAPSPTPRPAPRPAPASKRKAAPKAAPPPTAKAPFLPLIKVDAPTADDQLSESYDGDESKFSETIAGIVDKFGASFNAKDDAIAVDRPIGPSLDLSGDSDEPSLKKPMVLGIGATVVVAIVAAFWIFGGSDEQTPDVERASPDATVTEVDPLPETTPGVDVVSPRASKELLDEARLARDAGQIFNPPGSNAIELYVAAAAAAPDDDVISSELAAVLDQTISLAEKALLEHRADDATAALDRVAIADADNSRLPFLKAQLTQMQLRDHLDSARVAIRESRLQDAATSLNGARTLDISDTTEVDAVAAELSAARSEQRAAEVLAQAAQRLEQGQLIAPPNDNARYYYELVLSTDPGNTTAQQGLTGIASKLVLQARAEIDRGRFGQAQGFLSNASRLDPSSSEVAAVTQVLADARSAAAAAEEQEAARVAAEELAAEEEEAGIAAEVAAAEPEAAPVAEAITTTEDADTSSDGEPSADEVEVVTDEVEAAADENSGSTDRDATEEPDVVEPVVAALAANVVEPVVAALAANVVESTAVQRREAIAADDAAPVAISTLERSRYVAPKYPRAAERRNQSGWVDVVFTVAMDGSTKNIVVRNSEPGEVFVNAAVSAVERWEFEPVIESGRLVEKRAGVRMMFAIE